MISSHICLIPVEILLVSSFSGTTEYQIFRRICKNEVTKRSLETKPIHSVSGFPSDCRSIAGSLTRLRERSRIGDEITPVRRFETFMVGGRFCRFFIA